VPQESLQQEEPEQLTQEELNNVEQAIDNQHPAQDIYAALSSLSKDKLLLLQKDLHDRMVRSDDCLSNCNQDVIPQLMAYANYINEEARLSGSTVYWIKLLPGQGTPVAGEISSLVRILPTSFLIHLILILLMRRIHPLLQLCLV